MKNITTRVILSPNWRHSVTLYSPALSLLDDNSGDVAAEAFEKLLDIIDTFKDECDLSQSENQSLLGAVVPVLLDTAENLDRSCDKRKMCTGLHHIALPYLHIHRIQANPQYLLFYFFATSAGMWAYSCLCCVCVWMRITEEVCALISQGSALHNNKANKFIIRLLCKRLTGLAKSLILAGDYLLQGVTLHLVFTVIFDLAEVIV